MMSQIACHIDHILQMQRITARLSVPALCMLVLEAESNNMIEQIHEWDLVENNEYGKTPKCYD